MDILEVKQIWNEVKAELREIIPAHAFYAWLDAIEPAGFDNNIFSLITVHQMAPQIVRQSYYKQIISSLKKHIGRDDIDFSLSYDADLAAKYVTAFRRSRRGKTSIRKFS